MNLKLLAVSKWSFGSVEGTLTSGLHNDSIVYHKSVLFVRMKLRWYKSGRASSCETFTHACSKGLFLRASWQFRSSMCFEIATVVDRQAHDTTLRRSLLEGGCKLTVRGEPFAGAESCPFLKKRWFLIGRKSLLLFNDKTFWGRGWRHNYGSQFEGKVRDRFRVNVIVAEGRRV